MELKIYEKLLLLALKDDKGTLKVSFIELALSGSVLAELILENRIQIDDSKHHHIQVIKDEKTDDPLFNRVLENLKQSEKQYSLERWISKISTFKHLKDMAAKQLIDKGILKADINKILLIFKQKVYPEINHEPEEKVLSHLKNCIFEDHYEIDDRSIILIGLANSLGLLDMIYGRKTLKPYHDKIKQIIKGDLTSNLTQKAIQSIQAAIMIAVILPTIISTTTPTNH